MPLPVVGAPPPLPAWLKARLTVCRTKCARYIADGDRCGVQVDRGRAGHLQYMIDHPCPDCSCPAPDPLWGLARVDLPEDHVPTPTSDRLMIVVSAGKTADDQLALTGQRMRDYADRVGANFRVLRDDHAPHWPMANKWRIAPFIEQYEQTLYLDVDVIIGEGAPDIFDATPAESVAIYDEHSDVIENAPGDWIQREADAIADSQGMPRRRLDWMGNAGVIVFPRAAADLYRAPRRKFPRFWCFDQQYLAMQLDAAGFPVHRLAQRWNTGFVARNFWQAIGDAHFIHLNGSRPHRYRMDLLQRLLAGNLDRIDPPKEANWRPRWAPSSCSLTAAAAAPR